ncbi:deoxyguanosinetriphosphate triphosphohydrolase [Scatolibacter rhodanostii]|uniref:deoxyguanosinetriphosphate triphosphohydrolase n=1 Tax=Scatolibacter rhodanostii TaxID=2014781 RepID=UPI000C071930|nr:deoxyguanosinetriphosphate triphosphohydrolase [Scatolibacter rhodanostii]
MTIREKTEQLESLFLSPYAAFSSQSKGRKNPEPPVSEKTDLRTDYQRDRDRIIHCKSFRRLKHKTQVFLAPEGDHYRTRLTHTLEVAQIARTIAKAMRLNEDLTEAIALGHDLGHTPFGHAGERALNELLSGGFKHYRQSVRVVEKLEKDGEGLNLTHEVVDGILCHTTGQEAETLEGKLIRYADRIAYMNHDIDDAVRAGVLAEDVIPEIVRVVLGNNKSERITTLVCSVVENSTSEVIRMSDDVWEAYQELHRFMYQSVYLNDYAKREEKKVPHIIESLWEYFQQPENLPLYLQKIGEEEGFEVASADYVSGMTDHFAVEMYKRLFIPKGWDI